MVFGKKKPKFESDKEEAAYNAARQKARIKRATAMGAAEGAGGSGMMASLQRYANNPIVKGLGSAGGAFMENTGMMSTGSSGGSKKKKGKASKFAWET